MVHKYWDRNWRIICSFHIWSKSIRFSTNNTSLQVNVTGLKLIKAEGSRWSGVNYRLFVDEINRNATFVANFTNTSIASGLSNYEMTNWIPSDYRPKSQKFSHGYRGNNNIIYVWYDGSVGVANLTSSTQTNVNLACQIDWHY